jgi:hypothetical protein
VFHCCNRELHLFQLDFAAEPNNELSPELGEQPQRALLMEGYYAYILGSYLLVEVNKFRLIFLQIYEEKMSAH